MRRVLIDQYDTRVGFEHQVGATQLNEQRDIRLDINGPASNVLPAGFAGTRAASYVIRLHA